MFLEFFYIKKGLVWRNIKIKGTKIKKIGPAGPEVQAQFFISIFSFFKLGLTSLYGFGLGLASLAWSLAQASDQPGPCACMHELLTHALHSDRVIILRVGKNKRGYLVKLALGDEDDVKLTGRCYSPLQFFLYSSFSLFFAFCVFLHFLCLYLCSCSPCPVVPLFMCSLPQFAPVFLSWSGLFLVQWLLKMSSRAATEGEVQRSHPLFLSLVRSFVPCLCVSPCVVFFSLSTGFPVCGLSVFFFFLFSLSLHHFFVFSAPLLFFCPWPFSSFHKARECPVEAW